MGTVRSSRQTSPAQRLVYGMVRRLYPAIFSGKVEKLLTSLGSPSRRLAIQILVLIMPVGQKLTVG